MESVPGSFLQLSRGSAVARLVRTVSNPVDDGKDEWQFRDWPGADGLGVGVLSGVVTSVVPFDTFKIPRSEKSFCIG